MWLQFDHVVVHSRGGETSMENLIVTCPACNYGRDRYMMSEVGLRDPRLHPRLPVWSEASHWDGFERILPQKARYISVLTDLEKIEEKTSIARLEELQNLILVDPILASDGCHSARLWRVAENIHAQADLHTTKDCLLHLMSRVGSFCRSLAYDLGAGHITSEQAATLMDHMADIGDFSFKQWMQPL